MRSAWRTLAVASVSMAMLFSGPESLAAENPGTAPDDVARYHLGSILNGGSSSPGGDEFGPASAWVAAADAYYDASMRPNGTLPRIPVIWGSDAVHGHNNIVGASPCFPLPSRP